VRRPAFKKLFPLLALAAVALAGAQSLSQARHSVRHLQPSAARSHAALAQSVIDSAPQSPNEADAGCAFCEGGSSAPAIHRLSSSHVQRAPAQLYLVPWDSASDPEFFESEAQPRAPPAVSL
jgi:hypothetical protein